MRYIAVYRVWGVEAEIHHRGRISIVCQEDSGWQVEGVTSYGLNVSIFIIMAGWKSLSVIG